MLSPNEFRNAIYLDFEGEGRKRDGTVPIPHMAGLFRPNQAAKSGKYACAFFSETWKSALNGVKASKSTTFDAFFSELTIELHERCSGIVNLAT